MTDELEPSKEQVYYIHKEQQKLKKRQNAEITAIWNGMKRDLAILRAAFYAMVFCSGIFFGQFITYMRAVDYMGSVVCLIISLICVYASQKANKKLRLFNIVG